MGWQSSSFALWYMQNPLTYLPAPSWFTEPAFVGGGGSFLQPTQPLATWAHILLDA